MSRIQRKRTRGWTMPPNAVYVGRPTKWGNPFQMDKDQPRHVALSQYRSYVLSRPDLLAAAQQELRGKDLACWCREGEICHADVLIEIANQPQGETDQ